jgi:hypothetical protein
LKALSASLFALLLAVGAVGAPKAVAAQEGVPVRAGVPAVVTDGGSLQRPGVPRVLIQPAPAAPADPIVADRFAAAYAGEGRPRIVVFWNRAFDDRVATAWTDVTAQYTGTFDRRDGGDVVTAWASGAKPGEAPVRPGLDERSGWQFEAAFSRTFADAGVHFVDRAAIMRSTAAAGDADAQRPNLQAIEASALAAHADLLMEVLMTPDAGAPVGFAFRVTVKNLADGAILANVATSAVPPVESGYVATNRGFQKTVAAVGIDQAAHQLAIETMDGLLLGWGR